MFGKVVIWLAPFVIERMFPLILRGLKRLFHGKGAVVARELPPELQPHVSELSAAIEHLVEPPMEVSEIFDVMIEVCKFVKKFTTAPLDDEMQELMLLSTWLWADKKYGIVKSADKAIDLTKVLPGLFGKVAEEFDDDALSGVVAHILIPLAVRYA